MGMATLSIQAMGLWFRFLKKEDGSWKTFCHLTAGFKDEKEDLWVNEPALCRDIECTLGIVFFWSTILKKNESNFRAKRNPDGYFVDKYFKIL